MNPEKIKAQPELANLLTTAYYHAATGGIRIKKSELESAFASLVRQVEMAGMSNDMRWPLQTLAAHVFPLTPPAPKDDLGWLTKMATHRDAAESREWLKFIHVTQDYIEATDGFRLGRMVNSEGYPPGYYVPHLMQRLEEVPSHWRWPDTDRVADVGHHKPTETPLSKSSFSAIPNVAVDAWFTIHKGNEVAYNALYAKQAFNHPSKRPPSKTYILEDSYHTMRLEWPNGSIALLMPMRL